MFFDMFQDILHVRVCNGNGVILEMKVANARNKGLFKVDKKSFTWKSLMNY